MNEQMSMSKTTFYGSIALAVVLSLSIGVAFGGAFTMRQADAAIDAVHARDNEDFAALKKNFDDIMALNGQLQATLGKMNATAGNLLNRVGQDESVLKEYVDDAQASAGESTVIYERSPQLQIRFTGIRGLPILPLPGNAQELPRVLIPGRVKPMILAPDGDARQAVFFYVDKRNRMRGPYAPEVVKP
jgi:hypothetical protein